MDIYNNTKDKEEIAKYKESFLVLELISNDFPILVQNYSCLIDIIFLL